MSPTSRIEASNEPSARAVMLTPGQASPTAEQVAAQFAEHGIDFLGPPLSG